jgi:hypothetical protein
MNNEFLYMQKLAGLITEGEYQAKMNEGEYDSMSDHALIKAANQAGIEEIVVMDGEGGLANREEVIDHLNEFEHDNHGLFDAEMNEVEEEQKYDEDITKKTYKYGFYKLVYPNTPQYEIGDKVRVKDGRKIKIVTITDKKEIPYKNAGGNAFRPHSFQYEFK